MGLEVRAATRLDARMIAALGATPVPMPLPQVPESLSKGVVDGASVPWEGTPAIKLSEIAKYHLEVPLGSPRIGNTIFLFGMNQAKYDRGRKATGLRAKAHDSGVASSGSRLIRQRDCRCRRLV